MAIQELSPQQFLFQFGHEVDIKRILEGGPWAYENHPLLLERVKPGEDPELVELNHISMWIQVHNVPVGLMSKAVARGIGTKLEGLLESDPNNFNGMRRDFMRVRVKLHVLKLLKKHLKLKQGSGEGKEVILHYERLPTFCFHCGVIGHGEQFSRRNYEEDVSSLQLAYGHDMRA